MSSPDQLRARGSITRVRVVHYVMFQYSTTEEPSQSSKSKFPSNDTIDIVGRVNRKIISGNKYKHP